MQVPVQQPSGRAALPVEPGKDEFGRDLPASKAPDGEAKEAAEDGEEDMALDDSEDEGKPTVKVQTGNPADSSGGQALVHPPLPPLNQSSHAASFQRDSGNFGGPASNGVPNLGGMAPNMPMPASNAPNSGPTLDTFDRASFNPTDPTAWATLGQAWKASVGRDPNQMELMEWLATGMVGGFQSMMGGGGGGGGGGMGDQANEGMGR